MFTRNLLAALTVVAAFSWAVLAQSGDLVDKDGARIDALVKQLGSAKFSDREKAKKELESIGTPALAILKKAVTDADLETSKRAQELVRRIEDRMLTAEMLNPKRVRLNVNEKPVLDAVAELERLSGYSLQVVGDRAVLADKRVTLDTGDVTFFEALDQLCARAGLNEQVVGNTVGTPGGFGGRIRRGGFKIKAVPAPAIPGGVLPVVPPAPEFPKPAPKLDGVKLDKNLQKIAVVADEPEAKPAEQPKIVKEDPKVGKAIAVKGVVVGPGQVQVQVFPAFPDGRDVIPGGATGSGSGIPIQLQPGVHKAAPTYYSGSVRIRALSGKNLPPSTPKTTGLTVVLDALGEPRLHGFQLVGTPTILKAVDELGQELTVSTETPKLETPAGLPQNIMIFPGMVEGGIMTRRQSIVFKKDGTTGKSIKELKGTITAQAKIPNETLVKVENVMTAAGKTGNGANGGSLTVESIDRQADGTIRLKVRMENLQPNPFGMFGGGGGIVINGGVQVIQIGPGGAVIGGSPAQRGMPDLLDARGNKYQLVGAPSMRTNVNGGTVSQEATLLYRAAPAAGEPASLVLFGERSVNFQVPFTFRDLPLE